MYHDPHLTIAHVPQAVLDRFEEALGPDWRYQPAHTRAVLWEEGGLQHAVAYMGCPGFVGYETYRHAVEHGWPEPYELWTRSRDPR